MTDQFAAETATYMKHNKHERIFMRSGGFEPAIPAIKRLQTYALDLTATEFGINKIKVRKYASKNCAVLGHYTASSGEKFSATSRRKPQITYNMKVLLCPFLPGHPEKHCFV
jgi:hypothetical protein